MEKRALLMNGEVEREESTYKKEGIWGSVQVSVSEAKGQARK